MTHLDRNHPVAVLLSEAASGQVLTRADLDRLLIRDDLPEGSDLNRYRSAIAAAAEDIANIHATGANNDARQLAEDTAAHFAASMSEAERALTGSEPDPEPLDDIAARMFGHH